MTNEIEKQFFQCFGIEQKTNKVYGVQSNYHIDEYPQITDRILLELICIHNTYLGANLYSLDYESLKKEILKDLINEQESRELKKDYVADDMKQQVRTLFEEG